MGCQSGKTVESTPAQTAQNGQENGKAGGGDKEQTKKRERDNNAIFQTKLDFVSKVPLFTRLPKDQLPILAQNLEEKPFQPYDEVIKQGDPGSEFFLIKSGEAKVQVDRNEVAKLKRGDYFGENALVHEEPRNATIIATTDLVTYTLTRDQFRSLQLIEKLHFANRNAVGGGGARTLVTKPPTPKDESERELIITALRNNANMSTMVSLDDTRLNSLVDIAWKEDITKGTELIKIGDLVADYFYIVQAGSFEIFVSEDTRGEDDPQSAEKAVTRGESKYVSTVNKGGSFGELALLYLVPRAASVVAKEDSVVWVIDRKKFKDILMKVSDEKIREYTGYLDKVNVLTSLLSEEKKAIAQALIEMHFVKSEVILQQGEPGNTFYILYEGEVIVTKDGVEQTRLSAGKGADPQIFGERALLQSEPRVATISVSTHSAKALALSRDDFDMLLGPLQEIIRRGETSKGGKRESMVNKGRASKAQATNAQLPQNRERIHRKDLQKIGLLGCGGFGAVELFEHKKTGETYAMKALSKGYIVKTGMQESVMNEKNILMMTNSSFIIKLYEAYNGTQTLYFLMEPALGGELYATYNRKGFHGSEKHARFYVAGVVFAFEHVHERKIIYRDLKPENLLLTETGRLKLTDMGLAKFVIGKTYTTCGTPDYFAPELITSQGHTQAVDWWTLGVLIFELMSGHPPFESPYPMQIYQKVMKGINKVAFPQKCQGPVGDLIKALLKHNASERLPLRAGGVQNLKEHKWYADFVWKDLFEGKMEAPYKPQVKSKKDIANFSARKEDMPRQLEYKADGSNWDKDFATLPN